jgi:hypothetical protein
VPFTIAPNLIEVKDLTGGWQPDLNTAAAGPNALLSVLNFLPDIGSGILETRKGFKRMVDPIVQGYRVESLHPYNKLNGTGEGQYLIAVLSNHVDNASDNIQIFAINLNEGTATRIDTAGNVWASSDGRHYGVTIDETFYGGGVGDSMYSWNPDDGFSRDPSAQDFPFLVDNNDPSSNQLASNYAFPITQKVRFTNPDDGSDAAYVPTKSNRFPFWKAGTRYVKDHAVTISITDGGSGKTYPRSFTAKVTHTATNGNKPVGGGNNTWAIRNLDLPRDEDGDVTDDWSLVPTAAVTNIAAWHADRLFLQWANSGDRSLIQFSAPLKPTKNEVGQVEWDPKNFSIQPDKDTGDGGGFLTKQRTGDGDPVTALYDYGFYLIILKRRSAWVCAGLRQQDFIVRQIESVGAVGPNAVCGHEGLVYFFSDAGLFATDGTQVTEAPGAEKVRDWLRQAVDWDINESEVNVTMFSFGGFVWVSMPTQSNGAPNVVLVYDPHTKSVWKLDLAIQAAAVNKVKGVSQMFFSSPSQTGDQVGAILGWLGERGRSQSTRILNSITETNLFANPSFSVLDGETLTQARDNSGWSTSDDDVVFNLSPDAKLQGKVGAVVKNNGGSSTYKGIGRTFSDKTTSQHTMSGYFRRANWREFPNIDYTILRWAHQGDVIDSTHHKYIYIGNGWWRAVATYDGVVGGKRHSFVIRGGVTLQVDKLLCEDGGPLAKPWFDGDASDDEGGVTGGDWGLVYQYDHPDVQEIPSDDNGAFEYTSNTIGWLARLSWFPFGVLREVRRIRKIWAQVRGNVITTLRGFRNYSDDAVFSVDAQAAEGVSTSFFEGRKMPDAYAVSVSVEGVGSPASFIGAAIDTQPRRVEYHRHPFGSQVSGGGVQTIEDSPLPPSLTGAGGT